MFVNTFGMKCSTENFKRLIPKLESLGYKLRVPTYNKDSIIIREQRNWEFTDLDKDYIFVEYFEEFNEDLLLALAAMTEGDTPIVGEYMICLETVNDRGSWKSSKGEIIKVVSISDCGDPMQKGGFGKLFSKEYYRKATKEELINHFQENTFSKKQETMKVTRGQLKEIYDIGCKDWKTKISQLTRELLGDFGKEAEISEDKVEEMFQAATKDQLPTLERIFPLRKKLFMASDLKVGEMMEVTEGPYKGHIILKTYSGFVSVSDPSSTWKDCTLKGRKLNTGETVTIKQP